MRLLVLVAVVSVTASGQTVRFGIKAGVPVTAYFDTGRKENLHGATEYSAATRRYTVGGSAEWRLAGGFGFEIDALYKRMGYVKIASTSSNGVGTTSAIDVKGNSWDFPVMAKLRFSGGVRPYVAAGGVVRYVGPVRGLGELTVQDLIAGTTAKTPIDTSEPADLHKRVYPGVAAAGGVEFGAGRIRVLPEIRYTRWTANIPDAGGLLRFTPNQVELLVGFLL